MLSKKMNEILNQQINAEFYASYLYLAMSAYCEDINLPGFARRMRDQSDEERVHAMRLFEYIEQRDGTIVLKGVPEPPASFTSLRDVLSKALDHEKKVTGMIRQCYERAVKDNDYASVVELQWFIEEQVEEEKSASDLLARLELAGENGSALIILDSELGGGVETASAE